MITPSKDISSAMPTTVASAMLPKSQPELSDLDKGKKKKKKSPSVVSSADKGDQLTTEEKVQWNKFLDYLDKKKIRGKEELGRGGAGEGEFQKFKKQNPSITLEISDIPRVRKSYLNWRDEAINEIKSGRGMYEAAKSKEKMGANVDFSDFMLPYIENEKTANPNLIGKNITSMYFPTGETVVETKTSKTTMSPSAPLSPSEYKKWEQSQTKKPASSSQPVEIKKSAPATLPKTIDETKVML